MTHMLVYSIIVALSEARLIDHVLSRVHLYTPLLDCLSSADETLQVYKCISAPPYIHTKRSVILSVVDLYV